jgi:hypothetical protein
VRSLHLHVSDAGTRRLSLGPRGDSEFGHLRQVHASPLTDSNERLRARESLLKRTIIVVLCGLVVLALAPGASAAIKIRAIYFDSPGADNGSNSSLNNEWIRLKNTGTTARSLTNWTIRDTSSHVYRFGAYSLAAGKTVTIHSGNGANTARHRYWDFMGYVWNNDGDRATLKKPNGTVIDRCSYSGAGSSVAC